MKIIRHWLIPAFTVLALIIFVLTVAYFYDQSEKQYENMHTELIARGIAIRLKSEIQNRIIMLNVLANSQAADFQSKKYEDLAQMLITEYKELYAVNYVSPDGVIRKIFPREANKLALGRNLLEHEGVRDYLRLARDQNRPTISHLLMTYQKVMAFTLYIPLYTNDKKFSGWFNSVVDLDNWVLRYIDERKLDYVQIRIQWEHPLSETLQSGDSKVSQFHEYKTEILNQNLKISVGFIPTETELARNRLHTLIMSVGVLLLVVISILVTFLTRSKLRLLAAYERLDLNNTLVNSLTHDMSSPLMALTLNLDQALNTDESLSEKEKQRVVKALKAIREMLNSAKLLHAQRLGVVQIKSESVQLRTALNNAVMMVADEAGAKKVSLNVEDIPESVRVTAEQSTLVNNVFLNILNASVQTAPINAFIRVRHEVTPEEVKIIFDDFGRTITEEDMANYQLNFQSKSAFQSKSGLGLMQINSFMRAYGGSLELVKNTESVICIVLKFKKQF